MKRFTAQIRHSYDTILRMCRVQDDTFCFGRKILMALGGLALAVLGAWNLDSTAGLLFALVGCWLLVSLNYPAKSRAQSIRQALGGEYPTNRYEFYDQHFVLLAQNQDVVDYRKIVRLVEDDGYCYLFVSPQAAYMLEKASLGTELSRFRTFMEKAAGLSWSKPYKLTTFNLRTILELLRGETKTNKKKK